jgi:hypothetical protein
MMIYERIAHIGERQSAQQGHNVVFAAPAGSDVGDDRSQGLVVHPTILSYG